MKDLQTIIANYFDHNESELTFEYIDLLSHDDHSDSYYEDDSRIDR